MKSFDDRDLDQLYRRLPAERAPAALDAAVLAAAATRARRTRWMRRGVGVVPAVALALVLWPGAPWRPGSAPPPDTLPAPGLRDELARVGTPKPATDSQVTAWLLSASPYGLARADVSLPEAAP